MSEQTCRICLEGSELGRPLFEPCKCTGTMAFVHQDCLLTWQAEKARLNEMKCEVCGTSIYYGDYRAAELGTRMKYKWMYWGYLRRLPYTKINLMSFQVSILAIVYALLLILVAFPLIGRLTIYTLDLDLDVDDFGFIYYYVIAGLSPYFVQAMLIFQLWLRTIRLTLALEQKNAVEFGPPNYDVERTIELSGGQINEFGELLPIHDPMTGLVSDVFASFGSNDNVFSEDAVRFTYIALNHFLRMRTIANAVISGVKWLITPNKGSGLESPPFSDEHWMALYGLSFRGMVEESVRLGITVVGTYLAVLLSDSKEEALILKNTTIVLASTVVFPYLHGLCLYCALISDNEFQWWWPAHWPLLWLVGLAIYWWDFRHFAAKFDRTMSWLETGTPAQIELPMGFRWGVLGFYVKVGPAFVLSTSAHCLAAWLLKAAFLRVGVWLPNLFRPLNFAVPDGSAAGLLLVLLFTPVASFGLVTSYQTPLAYVGLVWLKDRVWLRMLTSLVRPNPAINSPNPVIKLPFMTFMFMRFFCLCVVLGIAPLLLGRSIGMAVSPYSVWVATKLGDNDLLLWLAGLALTLPWLGYVLLFFPPRELSQYAFYRFWKTGRDLDHAEFRLATFLRHIGMACALLVLRVYGPQRLQSHLGWTGPYFAYQICALGWPEVLRMWAFALFLATNLQSIGWLVPVALLAGDLHPAKNAFIFIVMTYPKTLVDYRDLSHV